MKQGRASILPSQTPVAARYTGRMICLLVAEGLASIAGTFLNVCIFFYTAHEFHWPLRRNLLLATAQGVVYVCGALSAHRITAALGRRRPLIALYVLLTVVIASGALWRSAAVSIAVLLGYSFLAAIAWPILESLVSGQSTGNELSRRLGMYNFVWSITGAGVMAISGMVIEYFPRGMFLIPAVCHLFTAILVLARTDVEQDTPAGDPNDAPHAEAALVSQRKLALWLSRIALPATYVVIYSLSATLPSLPPIKALPPRLATVAACVWLCARVVAFVVLGATAWWHTRPRLLLWAAIVMLIAFPAGLLPAALTSSTWALLGLLIWQLVLGAGMGIVYTASLYFGMVLSEGSTEHGGYHEGLIGLGQVLGPGVGAAAQFLWPGAAIPGILAVTALITLCVGGAVGVAIRANDGTR